MRAFCVNIRADTAYTIGMKCLISEREENARWIAYIHAAMLPYIAAGGATGVLSLGGGRAGLLLTAEDRCGDVVRRQAAEKIADVLAVGYKYVLFCGRLHTAGLNKEEREILLAALIAADLAQDKRYIIAALRNENIYTVDGFYTFRLKKLRRKWEDVIGCLPALFTEEKLAAFLHYLACGNGRGKVLLRGEELYDGGYRKLRRATLIEEGASELNSIREIILSGAGEVECAGMPTPKQALFLKKYYAGKVCFA